MKNYIFIFLAATSADGLSLNYRVIYVEDACRGVDNKDIDEQKRKLVSQGAIMINSKQVGLFYCCENSTYQRKY